MGIGWLVRGFTCIAAAWLAAAVPAWAKSFELPRVAYSAERLVQGGERWQSMRVRYTPGMERMDLTGNAAGGNVVIIRYDRRVTWVVMPAVRAYLELPVDVGARLSTLAASLTLSERGAEPVNGVPAVKYKVDGDLDGFMWLSREGIPLRIEGEATIEGRSVPARVEQRDLVIARQDPALFELPSGYSRIELRDPQIWMLLQQFMPPR